MGSKKTSIMVAAILAALVLSGWSCGGGAGMTNTEPETYPEVPDTTADWQTYRNTDWGVLFRYPASWNYREYVETIEGEEITTLAFSDQELPETLPPEPSFPIMVSRDDRTVDEVVAVHTDAISVETSTVREDQTKIITRYSDIMEANYRIYLTPLRIGSIQFVSFSVNYDSIVEDMVDSIIETE